MAAHRDATHLPPGRRAARLGIAGLALLGVADSMYMLAYHGRLVRSLVCPFFGEGCNIVGRSPHATNFGVPNSALGVMAYALMATLALWSGVKSPEERPLPPLVLASLSVGASLASALLTWEQATRVKAWCFWCLLSAGLNLVILTLATRDGWSAAQSVLRSRAVRVRPGTP